MFSLSLAARASCIRMMVPKTVPSVASICGSHAAPVAAATQCRALSLTSSDRAVFGMAPRPKAGPMLASTHWTIERVLAISMLPLYPIALYVDGPAMNLLVVSAVTMHSYWGLDGVIRDYAFERRYGPMLMPALQLIWKIFCGCGFAGLLYFNYNDVGFISAVKKLWAM